MTVSILTSYGHFRRSLARLSAEQLREAELGFNQMSIIYYLASGEASTAAELAEFTQTDRAAVSRSLGTMADAGLLTRKKDPADRRREIIKLTASGRDKAREAFAARDRIAAKIARTLEPREAKELARLLEKAAQA